MEIECSSSTTDPSVSNSSIISNGTNKSLLSCVKSLVELELSLTQSLSDTSALLELSVPQSMSQVNTILSLARTYSTRTSAPPGWNPNLPVIHFSTPNPLPHQLRQGALGAMELNFVKEERAAKRRKIEQDLLNKKALEELKRRKDASEKEQQGIDPKRKEVMDHVKMEDDVEKKRRAERKTVALKKQNEKMKAKVAALSMNLSDSDDSSSEEDTDSD
eukprot:scaffold3087_cov288-Chaetoceros_neogracile.AAC.21